MFKESMHFDELCPVIRSAGVQPYMSGHTPVRRIYDHEIMMLIEGGFQFQADDRMHALQENDILIIRPDVPHVFHWGNNAKGHLLWAHLDLRVFRDASEINYLDDHFHQTLYHPQLPWKRLIRPDPVFENGFTLPEVLTPKDPAPFRAAMRQLVDSHTRQDMFWQLDCRHLMLQFLHRYLQACFSVQAVFRNAGGAIAPMMRDYVARNLRNRLTLDSMARIFGYNGEYLGKRFAAETGIHFSDYVNQTRLQLGIELLRTSSLNLANIAELCGFRDAFYFSRVMKRHTGKSPSDHRRSSSGDISP